MVDVWPVGASAPQSFRGREAAEIIVPRRLSARDPDFDPALGARLQILFDGEDQAGRAEGYDLDAGTVTRARYNVAGEIFVEDDKIAMETVRGAVTVTVLRDG